MQSRMMAARMMAEQMRCFACAQNSFKGLPGCWLAPQQACVELLSALSMHCMARSHANGLSCTGSLDEQDPAVTALASLAKAAATRTARAVMNEAVQMHGGVGVTDDFDIGFFFKRARVAGEMLGDDYFHKERLAEVAWGQRLTIP